MKRLLAILILIIFAILVIFYAATREKLSDRLPFDNQTPTNVWTPPVKTIDDYIQALSVDRIDDDLYPSTLVLVGEVKNVSDVPCEPKVQIVGYDKDGRITDVWTGTINDYQLIHPGSTITFKIRTIKTEGMTSWKGKIIQILGERKGV